MNGIKTGGIITPTRKFWLDNIKWMTVLSVLVFLPSCSGIEDNPTPVTVPELQGKIASYNEFGGAMVDFTAASMTAAGFTLGDVISLTVAGKEIVMPYYDGYYGSTGDYMFVAYPTYPTICFTANNIGLPQDLLGLEGQPVTIRLVEKGGKADVQTALSMKYTNVREDFLSDDAFANARAANFGDLAPNRLHRSSSPFNDLIKRTSYVSEYLERQQVKTVLNLADTEEQMKSYDLPSYSRQLWESGHVILCPLKADPTADDYNKRLIAALKELPSHPGPYVVHCQEGKDRTGYVCALLEGLCGASYQEMVDDYLITYDNYYQKTPQKNPDVCNTLLSLRLNPCLMYYAGISDEAQLKDVDYRAAFSAYLLSHGMTQEQLDALVQALTAEKL